MIDYQQDGAIARLTVARADKKNAFTTAMWQALLGHCQAIQAAVARGAPDAPRVLLLQGQAGAFCAGADLQEMTVLVQDPQALAANNAVVTQAQLALEQLPLPTLAVVDGPCFGGGFGLAAACDFRIGSTRSRYAITPARLGLVYSLEDTRRVLRLLGDARTRQMLLRSLQLDAATALQWGVLDAVFEPADLAAAATARAQALALQSPTSMAGIKATLACLGHPGSSAADAVEAERAEAIARAACDAAYTGPDFAEGAAAFVARRPPNF